MELPQIKELLEFIDAMRFHELEIEKGDVRIKMVRGAAPQAGHQIAQEALDAPTGPKQDAVQANSPAGLEITAPIPGLFYTAPSPEQSAFVKVGQRVKKGETICILEAMKMMNEIPMPEDGVIEAVLIENGHPVEIDQPMFIYRIDA